MRRTYLFSILFSFCFIIISCSTSLGKQDLPCGKYWTRPLLEVTGEIIDTYVATPAWTYEEGLHLTIKTSSGKINTIHVFPTQCTDNYSPDTFQFTIGEFVTVTGSRFYTSSTTSDGLPHVNICAAEINLLPNMALRTLDTGCLNEEICRNCPGFCDEKCAGIPKPETCIETCLQGCETRVTPCIPAPDVLESLTPSNLLLLN